MTDYQPVEHTCEKCGVISPLHKCTFCGSTHVTIHEEEGFEPRAGCQECDRWLQPERRKKT